MAYFVPGVNYSFSKCFSFLDGGHFVSCGAPNNCGSTHKIDPRMDDEVFAVRCVSDLDRRADGWDTNPGCAGIWTKSDFGGCQYLNWAAAKDFCEQQNGRLPTAAELLNGCTELSGCHFDDNECWSSTAVTTGDENSENSGDNKLFFFEHFFQNRRGVSFRNFRFPNRSKPKPKPKIKKKEKRTRQLSMKDLFGNKKSKPSCVSRFIYTKF